MRTGSAPAGSTIRCADLPAVFAVESTASAELPLRVLAFGELVPEDGALGVNMLGVAAFLAGALTGSRSANPAFGGVLDKAESAVPTVPFAITYALANVLLTLLGPLVVGLV